MGDLLLLRSPVFDAKCSTGQKCFCACVLSTGIRQDITMSHSVEVAAQVPSGKKKKSTEGGNPVQSSRATQL